MNPNRCPLTTSDFDLIQRTLQEMSLDEVIFLTEQLFGELSAAEKVTYDINRFCSAYSDIPGRIRFIKALIDDGVIASIHIPLSYQRDSRLVDLIRSKQYEYFIPKAE